MSNRLTFWMKTVKKNKWIFQYLRKKNGAPYGVLVAVRKQNGDVSVDFSLCNIKKDKFNKSMALEIAVGRALSDKVPVDRKLPPSILKEIDKFNDRASRYYKTSIDEIITWA